jgi:hypothetical protein
MKKIVSVIATIMVLLLPVKASAQMQELQQLALNIEKLSQFRAILRDMKKGYEILTEGYNTVKDLTEGNFTLHETFLDAMLQVSPQVRNYKRVAQIIDYQIALMERYGNARERFSATGLYSQNELAYMDKVYDKLINESLRNLEELTMVLTSGQARMSDNERIEIIEGIYSSMQDKLLFLGEFNNEASLLGLQRAKEMQDIKAMRMLTGVTP